MRKTLKIGILSYEKAKDRTLAITRGELIPGPDEPKVFLPSVETLGKILSERNRELLMNIKTNRPGSLADLSTLTGRAVSNLSRTLKTMERYGLVSLVRVNGTVRPEVPYDEVALRLSVAV